MNSKFDIIKVAKESIEIQGESVLNLSNLIDENFKNSVNLLASTKGRIILTGVGKSAIIGMKIVATLNSTGSPAVFMHAAEALHGDLGIVQNNDIVIILSKSGNTQEIKQLIPFLKKTDVKIISISSDTNSFLAKNSNYFINSYVKKEACPNNLAPTSSTTAQLVIGDALAICLLEIKGFNKHDFAKYHPGGSLGKKLYTKVIDLLDTNLKPEVKSDEKFENIINEISKNMLGATAVINNNNNIVGVITDGDLRRFFSKKIDQQSITANEIMTKSPLCISSEILASDALKIMKENKITQLLVTENKNYLGIIHLHNILKEGIS